MKEKIKKFVRNNAYYIVIFTILCAYFIFLAVEIGDDAILAFILTAPFFIAIILFLYHDKKIKEYRIIFNERFSSTFVAKTLAIIFRILLFLIFLFSVFIIINGTILLTEKSKLSSQSGRSGKSLDQLTEELDCRH